MKQHKRHIPKYRRLYIQYLPPILATRTIISCATVPLCIYQLHVFVLSHKHQQLYRSYIFTNYINVVYLDIQDLYTCACWILKKKNIYKNHHHATYSSEQINSKIKAHHTKRHKMSSVKNCIQGNSSVNTESQNDNVSKIHELILIFCWPCISV